MAEHNLTAAETRERSRLVDVHTCEVRLDLRSAPDQKSATFGSITTLRFRCAEPGTSTHVDLVAPDVHAVTLNGRSLEPAEVYDGSRVHLADLAADNVLVVDAACAYSSTGQGLHRFVDPVDGETYLYTHYEPADARRVFANFEQPDLKASFSVEVTAPGGWTVLSNAPAAGDPLLDAGTATWTFEPTPPISTYITAVVAGPYHHERDRYRRELPDGSTLEIPLGALCRASLSEHFDAAEIFEITKAGFDFFHDAFGYPYPFGKYDQAFVPEYNIGAMENPGCVTFREEYVFRGRVTQASYEARANTLLHEMAHMWFGDLVTMQWWDDLWLKESFADYMGTLALAESTRFTDAWVTFANRRKVWAYTQDQLPTTHPITADIRDLEDAKLNFDGITYAKGASVLKQLVAYVGREQFLEGARRYFERFAYASTTLADLLDVLEETSGRDLRAWSRAWLQTAGVCTLTPQVELGDDGRVRELAVLQEPAEDFPTLRPHRTVVGLYSRTADGALVRDARSEVDLEGPRTVVPELAGAPRPDLVLVNDEDLTYAKMRFDEVSLRTLRAGLGDIADPMPRALCWSGMWNLTRDGVLPGREYVELVDAFAGRESSVSVLQTVHQTALTTLTHYLAPDHRERAAAQLADVAARELRAAPAGSGHQLAWVRLLAGVATTPSQHELLQALLSGDEVVEGLEVDQELRWALLEPLVAAAVVDEAAVTSELRRDETASGQRHHARCMAARPSAAAKAEVWRRVVETDELTNAMVDAQIAGFNQPNQRELLAEFIDPYFEQIAHVWSTRNIEIAMRVVSGLFPALQASAGTLSRTDAWLAQAPDAPALRRLVLEARDQLARALHAQACDTAAGTRTGCPEPFTRRPGD